MSAAELGLVELAPPAGEPAPELTELTERLTFARLDAGLVDLLRGQTQSIRLLDRRLGGLSIYRQATAHVTQIEDLVRFALPSAERAAAADELGQAAALAGWQALDLGQLDEAWRLHEIAKGAARESGVIAGLVYASAQQAYVLLDAGRPDDALAVVAAARAEGGSRIPPALLAWLHAAESEVLAALGLRDDALRMLDDANAALPDDPDHEDMPYLMLSSGHLARWRGHCLARLGEASAIEDLTGALDAMGEGQYGRAEAGLRVDLALAFQARGDTTVARLHARRASEVVGRTGSQRQRRRIAELLSA
jgi:tetratricopeptide (TPR) repeat protein